MRKGRFRKPLAAVAARYSESQSFDRRLYRNDIAGSIAHAAALAKADKDWLARLITRKVPLSRWREAFEPRDDDVKVALDFTA